MKPARRRRRAGQLPAVPGPASHDGLTDEEYGRAVCASKIDYPSEWVARNAGWLLGVRYPDADPLEPYDCPWCPDWHLGPARPAS